MKIIPTDLPEVMVHEPPVFADEAASSWKTITDALRDVGNRQRRVHVRGPGIPLRPVLIHGAAPDSIGIEPERAEFARPGRRTLPLPPQQTAQPSPQPLVESRDGPQALRVLEVTKPTSQQRVQILDRVG
jgi:hypothetical protein